jgi:hypothetical protein
MEGRTSRSTRPATWRHIPEGLSSRARGAVTADYFHIFSLEAVIFFVDSKSSGWNYSCYDKRFLPPFLLPVIKLSVIKETKK